MSSDELSLADDSQDDALSDAPDNLSQNGDAVEDMDDLFGDNPSDQEEPLFVTSILTPITH